MSEFEQQPDDFWRKAFEEASETPPPRVWDAIERRLDESEGPRVLPLWSTGLGASRPVLWGAGLAAAVAVLLVGWWALQTPATRPAGTSIAQANRSQPRTVTPTTPSVNAPAIPSNRVTRPADVTLTPTPDADVQTLALNARRPVGRRRVSAPVAVGDVNSIESLAQANSQLPGSTARRLTDPVSAPALVTDQPSPQPVATTPSVARSGNSVALVPAPPVTLTEQGASSINSSVAQPAALRKAAESPLATDAFSAEPEVGQPNRKSREVWASVSLMPGAFDPAVAIRTVAASAIAKSTAVNYAVSNTPTINSRANFSVAYQASAGVQLNEHWSVESGVGYLSARSTVDSPTQAASYANQFANQNSLVVANPSRTSQNVVGTLYVDALRNQVSTTRTTGLAVSADALITNNYPLLGTYSNQARQTLTNNYQYVQVPVQVGYQLRPRKLLGLALLGGFLTNIFVRNTVADEVVITSRDGVYRPLSWAASLGARFRYRPSRRWSASLAGLYQPSLGLGTRPESVVQNQPTSVGMSFGVDYHF